MSAYRERETHWADPLVRSFFKLATTGIIPARWFQPALPDRAERAAKRGVLELEIVTHCWQYAHFLVHQLTSIADQPPTDLRVTVTVFYSESDKATSALLDHFGTLKIPGVTWNWWALSEPQLFRRAIGRNLAAKATRADWVWFTDCDLMFRDDCLDQLAAALQGNSDSLVYPRQELVTPLLADSDEMLSFDPSGAAKAPPVALERFYVSERGRATGPLQITHGDIARAGGYCDALGFYQRPSASWRKATEDRAFRWLLETQGEPIDVPGGYRIRHVSKGRYSGEGLGMRLRGWTRRLQSVLRDRHATK